MTKAKQSEQAAYQRVLDRIAFYINLYPANVFSNSAELEFAKHILGVLDSDIRDIAGLPKPEVKSNET